MCMRVCVCERVIETKGGGGGGREREARRAREERERGMVRE